MEPRAVYTDYRIHGVVILAFFASLVLISYAAGFAWRDTIAVLDVLGGNFVVVAGGSVGLTGSLWLAIESGWAAAHHPAQRAALVALTLVNAGGMVLTALLLLSLSAPDVMTHAARLVLGGLWMAYGALYSACCWAYPPPLLFGRSNEPADPVAVAARETAEALRRVRS